MRQDPIKLYWWKRTDMVNLGDELNRFVVERVSGRKVVHADHDSADLLAIGSVLNFPQDKAATQRKTPWLVWGSGTLNSGARGRTEKFLCSAVRGPLTLSVLGPNQAPVPFGDPGILTSAIWPEKGPKKYRWGIVPHYAHLNLPWVKKTLEETPDSVMIDVRDPDVQAVCELIASCEFIASTSLHGLIIADSYGIPNVWLTEGGVNASWKYWDYFSGVGRCGVRAVHFNQVANLTDREARMDSQAYQTTIPVHMKRLAAAFPI